MPNNLPARIQIRAETETTPATASSASDVAPAETCTPIPRPSPEPRPASTAFTGLVLDRRALAFALRFASRVASRAVNGRRASALRFGDTRVQALLHALVLFVFVARGFSNKDLREQIARCSAFAPDKSARAA